MQKIISHKIDQLMRDSGVSFGTSGARGAVESMTDEVCYAYVCAFLQALKKQSLVNSGGQVFIAGDLRDSTPGIMAASAKAIIDSGYAVVNAGFIPSPAVAGYAMSLGAPSIMVTGSHIPDDRNGIKFNRPDGEILKADEALIKAQTVDVPAQLMTDSSLPAMTDDAGKWFINRYLNFYPASSLQGMRIGLYEHSGVGREVIFDVLSGLGAQVTRLARSEQFIPVDTEAIRDADQQLARQWSADFGFDAIVSTDGDADRPLISDEKGEWLRGDIVGVLCGQQLGIDVIVTPVSSNSAVELSGLFTQVYRTRIGSPFVIKQMQQALGTGLQVAGYEANGGFLLATDVKQDGRTLSALPTRDALLPILAVLTLAQKKKLKISALLDALPPRFTASDRLKDFPTELSQRRIENLADSNALIEAEFGDLSGKVKKTDVTDGLRVTFDNGEIIHLRPSGNAPELRCYNEADTVGRAVELNRACLAKMANWR